MGGANPELPVQTGMVDTHCHLFLVDREPSLVVEAAREAGSLALERKLSILADGTSAAASIERS